MSKAVFLDRDGTIIKDKDYLSDPNNVEWIPGATETLQTLANSGFKLVVVTNQSGVARGYMTEEDVRAIHDELREQASKDGIQFEGFYYCPYLMEGSVEEYSVESDLRKPAPGMILRAADDLGLDLNHSYMIGDKGSDIEAGQRAGCKSILVKTGYGEQTLKEVRTGSCEPDYVADSITEAGKWILNRTS